MLFYLQLHIYSLGSCLLDLWMSYRLLYLRYTLHRIWMHWKMSRIALPVRNHHYRLSDDNFPWIVESFRFYMMTAILYSLQHCIHLLRNRFSQNQMHASLDHLGIQFPIEKVFELQSMRVLAEDWWETIWFQIHYWPSSLNQLALQ